MERGPQQGGEYHHNKHVFTPDEQIEVGIIGALNGDLVIDEHTARTIAAQVGSIRTPMLDLFTHTGAITDEAYDELSRVRLDHRTQTHQARWIDWLVRYWQARQREQASVEPAGAERVRPYRPRVFVVDLASLESRLDHGTWIDANQPLADLKADIATMLDRSPVARSDRWTVGAFHDFAGITVTGFTDPALISRLGRGIHEHGAAYSSWVYLSGTDDPERLDHFADFYVASFDRPEDWTQSIADSLQQLDGIDHAKSLHDLVHYRDVIRGHDGRIHVFRR